MLPLRVKTVLACYCYYPAICMDGGLPPGKPGQPSGARTRVAVGSLERQEGPTSRAAAVEAISESIISIHDGLAECPADVVEHVAFLVSEAALAVANSLRCDRLAIQEAAAPSPAPSGASEGSAGELELAEEEEVGQRSVSVSLPPSPGDSPRSAEGSPSKVRKQDDFSHVAEREEGDSPLEGRTHGRSENGDEAPERPLGS